MMGLSESLIVRDTLNYVFFPFLLHKSVSYLNLYSQSLEWLLPILILPLIKSSATPDNPTGAI